jgi:hypothetical protein
VPEKKKHWIGGSKSFGWIPSASDALIVSICYIFCFLVVHHFLYPAQTWLLGGLETNASLLFLPHGVRILAAWLLGWRSVIALAPGAIIMHVNLLGELAVNLNNLLSVIVGISVAAATFHAFRLAGWNLLAEQRRSMPWRGVMLVGLVASGANAVLTNFFLGSSFEQYIAYLIGDFLGLFAVMTALMLVFRYFDRRNGLRR